MGPLWMVSHKWLNKTFSILMDSKVFSDWNSALAVILVRRQSRKARCLIGPTVELGDISTEFFCKCLLRCMAYRSWFLCFSRSAWDPPDSARRMPQPPTSERNGNLPLRARPRTCIWQMHFHRDRMSQQTTPEAFLSRTWLWFPITLKMSHQREEKRHLWGLKAPCTSWEAALCTSIYLSHLR